MEGGGFREHVLVALHAGLQVESSGSRIQGLGLRFKV